MNSSGTSGTLSPVQEVATPGPEGDVVWVVSSVIQSIGRVTYLFTMLSSRHWAIVGALWVLMGNSLGYP